MLYVENNKKKNPPKISGGGGEIINCSERDTPPLVIWRIQIVTKMRVVKI